MHLLRKNYAGISLCQSIADFLGGFQDICVFAISYVLYPISSIQAVFETSLVGDKAKASQGFMTSIL